MVLFISPWDMLILYSLCVFESFRLITAYCSQACFKTVSIASFTIYPRMHPVYMYVCSSHRVIISSTLHVLVFNKYCVC